MIIRNKLRTHAPRSKPATDAGASYGASWHTGRGLGASRIAGQCRESLSAQFETAKFACARPESRSTSHLSWCAESSSPAVPGGTRRDGLGAYNPAPTQQSVHC